MKKTQPLRKLTESKVFWAFISLLMALALWIYIVSLSSDEFTRTFRGVPVQLINEDMLRSSRNMVITNLDTNSVTVTVVGPRRIVSALSAEDIVAQVDVSRDWFHLGGGRVDWLVQERTGSNQLGCTLRRLLAAQDCP